MNEFPWILCVLSRVLHLERWISYSYPYSNGQKERDIKVFNIGMSPLSNVGQSKYSFLSEKIAAQIFLHGQYFYHFKGLKNFKVKYADFWESKYVAYRKKSSLPFTMAQITLLIGKKRT